MSDTSGAASEEGKPGGAAARSMGESGAGGDAKGGAGGANGGAADGDAQGGAGARGDQDGQPKARADGKPGWLPEKFKSEEDLATSYKELERRQFTRKEELQKQVREELDAEAGKHMPKVPADYTFTPVKLGDKELKLNPDDPLTKWFQQVAWDSKLSQSKFEKLVGEYIKTDMMRGPDWTKESAVLGPAADKRLDRIAGWARGNLPQELYDSYSRIPATAEMVKLFEHVMTLAGEPTWVPDESEAGFKENLTRQDLQAMMKDEKYWKDKDPRFIAQVRAGFRRLSK